MGETTERLVEGVGVGESVAAHDLSMVGLFFQADIIVKVVMIVLLLSSVWCWAIIFEKKTTIARLRKKAKKFEDAFWSGEALDKLYQRVKKAQNDPLVKTFCAGMEEWQNTARTGIPDAEGLQASLKQRVERAMQITINKEMDALEKGMTFLATVGSTAPFIGLFGTVWGIMNSFSAIATTQNTSLAVVAPGIAEALFATALGLVAAIPAVIAYNGYSNGLGRYAGKLDAFANEFQAILSRHLESQKKRVKNSKSADEQDNSENLAEEEDDDGNESGYAFPWKRG